MRRLNKKEVLSKVKHIVDSAANDVDTVLNDNGCYLSYASVDTVKNDLANNGYANGCKSINKFMKVVVDGCFYSPKTDFGDIAYAIASHEKDLHVFGQREIDSIKSMYSKIHSKGYATKLKEVDDAINVLEKKLNALKKKREMLAK